ncbi:TPA: CopG family transcriptional regulator [Candidatus Micrarchaeota archaeon]|nr:CopG family transcriptional regulator [Candidatus Micrarchaeota archaeon]
MLAGSSTSLSVPSSLYNKVKDQIGGTGFSSVSDYVTFVLRELVTGDKEEEEAFSKEDEEKVKERLRSLGYLD